MFYTGERIYPWLATWGRSEVFYSFVFGTRELVVLALTELGRRYVWVLGPIPCPMIIGYPRSPGLTNPELIREIVRAERASPCSRSKIHDELLRHRGKPR